ncbi:Pfs, NB-ARC and TPR domain protein [Aspergillus bertholletiae]|uniref:Pfs, NB-ARC and TPR domain protein n=1 Tax=Aspergillus bertholletiae TaxID=1226010 RepID=A0A5N7B8U6_9EURO|nr:Pfs, NB-ARC and TPR domain protein [Aspergillus bertholletiae]
MRRLSHDQYTVGWICALPLEMAAAVAMLDEIHEDLPVKSNDGNAYTLGRIGNHNVVMACLPSGQYGTTSATAVAIQLRSSFQAVRFGLMVGIGGGIPSSKIDIRLGDVVVSQPSDKHGGVIQYDFGKALQGGHFQRRGLLNCPPQALLTALARLQAKHRVSESAIPRYLAEMFRKYPRMQRDYSSDGLLDILYADEYCATASANQVDFHATRTLSRVERVTRQPTIHYGLIASGNQVVKDSLKRDSLAKELGACCVEMEAAGLMNHYPCLLVRGICDYADAHKDSKWQGYAAAVASAYAKELLTVTSVTLTLQTPKVQGDRTSRDTQFVRPLNLEAMTIIGNFLGRHDELRWLRAKLDRKAHPRRRVVVLHGLDGIGKTHAVFLINCRDRETLLQSLASTESQLYAHGRSGGNLPASNLEQRAQRVLDWLALPQNTKWLLIYDNLCHSQNAAFDIRDFFPSADHGSIIITTHILSFTELGESLNIIRLKPEKANKLLLQNNRELVSRLDGHPLATVLAGMFIKRTGIDMARYLKIYKTSWRALQMKSTALDTNYNRSIIHAWNVSYTEMQANNPVAAELLIILAFYNHRDISMDILKNAARYSNSPQWFRDLVSDELSLATVVSDLVGFSMIEPSDGNMEYSMHPVFQEWCRRGVVNDGNTLAAQYQHMVLISLSSVVSLPDNAGCCLWQRKLLPHATSIVRELTEQSRPANSIEIIEALRVLGNLFLSHGMHSEAERAYRLAYTGSTRILDKCDYSALALAKSRAKLSCFKGQFTEALRTYKDALTRQESTLGPEHPLTLSTLNDIGTLFCLQGKLETAQSIYQHVLAVQLSTVGPAHVSSLILFNNLGNVFLRAGNLKDAEAFYRQSLEGRERVLSGQHPHTLATINNLANLYFRQGHLDRAEDLYLRALQGRAKILGDQHLLTLASMNNIGNLYVRQRKYKDAEYMFNMSLRGRESTLGDTHTMTLATIHNLGNLYCGLRRWEEAQMMYHRALSGRNLLLGPHHPSTAATFSNLKKLLLQQGRIDELATLFRQPLLSNKHRTWVAEDNLSWILGNRTARMKFFHPSLPLFKYFSRIRNHR